MPSSSRAYRHAATAPSPRPAHVMPAAMTAARRSIGGGREHTSGPGLRRAVLGQLHGEEDRILPASHPEQDALSLLTRLEGLAVGSDVLHGLLVDFEDHIAAPQPSLLGGASRFHPRHHDAVDIAPNSQTLRDLRREGLHG